MVAEVTITVKNSEKKLVTNHLIYDNFTVSDTDPLIHDLVKETVKQFNDDVEKTQVRIVLEWD